MCYHCELRLCNRCVLQVCVTGMYVLQVFIKGVYYRCILQVCVTGLYYSCVIQVCITGVYASGGFSSEEREEDPP